MQACEASLKRLGIDVIDLYYQHASIEHADRRNGGPDEAAVEQGKVARWTFRARPETSRRAHKIHPIAAVQNEYSLLYRTEGEETLRTTRELGIGFVPYAPLGRSMLTGTVHGKADVPRATGACSTRASRRESGQECTARLPAESIAREKKCTPRSWCSPGCSRRAATSCRSRHQAEAAGG